MKILSPDALAVDLVDRMLAIPQRQGITLPRLLGGFLACSIGALGVESAVCLALGLPMFALLMACLAGLTTFGVRAQRRVYRSDASTWGPERVTHYRSLAMWHRQSMALARLVLLLGCTFFFAHTFAGADWSRWPVFLLLTVPMVLSAAFMLLQQYGACALPRDPDLRQRTTAFTGDGASA
jgi:hypothetical protein